MRSPTGFVAFVLLLSLTCAGEQTLVNDSLAAADGVHIEFSQPVEITAVDPCFPHYHPPEASANVWFFGWKLFPQQEIVIDWRPRDAEVVGVHWLSWQAAIPLDPPGLVDSFDDGNLISNLNVEWIPSACSEGLKIASAHVVGDADGAFLELELTDAGIASLTIDFAPRDVSAYQGIFVRASASAPLVLSVELMARDPSCETGYRFVNPAAPLPVTGDPAALRFPFSAFAPEPGSCPADGEGRLTGRLIHIGIFVTSEEAATLRVQEVGFY